MFLLCLFQVICCLIQVQTDTTIYIHTLIQTDVKLYKLIHTTYWCEIEHIHWYTQHTHLYIQQIYTMLKFEQTSQIIFEVVNDIPGYKCQWSGLGVTGDSGSGVGGTGDSCGGGNVEDTDDSGGEVEQPPKTEIYLGFVKLWLQVSRTKIEGGERIIHTIPTGAITFSKQDSGSAARNRYRVRLRLQVREKRER